MSGSVVTTPTYQAMIDRCVQSVEDERGRPAHRRSRQRRGARDAALFALAFTVGLKVSELCDVKMNDYTPGSTPYSDGVLIVRDRRPASRRLPIVGTTREHVTRWIEYHEYDSEHLFFPISKKNVVYDAHLSQSGLNDIAKRRSPSESVSFQGLRRSFKHHLKAQGVKDAIVRDLMGLASRRTVPRDDETADEKMKVALRQMSRDAEYPRRGPRVL
jgi:site-specific recombinase XerD